MKSYSTLKFIDLPENFSDISYKASQIPCPVLGHTDPKYFCLFCGEYFCDENYCCEDVVREKHMVHSLSGYFAFMEYLKRYNLSFFSFN